MFPAKLRKSSRSKTRADSLPNPQLLPEIPAAVSYSPVPHLLTSNDAPSEEETAHIYHALGRAEAELAELTNAPKPGKGSPTHLWEYAQGLDKQPHPAARKVKSFIKHHRALLSAMRRIPPELLQEIILWSAAARPLAEVQRLRWELGQVSRAWRAATLDLSVLWAVLPRVTFPPPAGSLARRQLACLEEVLRRAGDAPLTVTIDTDDAKASRETTHAHPAVNVLVRHAERWATASICMPHISIVALREIRGRLPMLKTLSLQIRVGYHSVVDPLDMFEHAPQLRRVHVSGAVPSGLKLPVAQLQHYKHLCITERNMVQLGTYAALESLMISQQAYGIVFPAATLPLLRRLEVVANLPAQEATMRCFSDLRAPALEELTVAFPFTSPSIIPSIITMLKKSGKPRLHSLRLRPGTTEPLQLTALLELTPDLVRLDTTCPPHVDVQNLAGAARRAPLALRLQSCKFAFDFVIERFTDAPTRRALNQLAEARCEREDGAGRMVLCVYSVFNQVDDMPWSHFKQRQLEEWAPTPTSKTLEKLTASLATHLRVATLPKPERVLSLGKEQSPDKIRQVLQELGNVAVKSAKDVYLSGAHLTLKHLANTDPALDKHGFGQRAKQILGKWDYVFVGSLAHVHWSFQGPYSLLYVPSKHEIRTSREALDVVYGLKDQMSSDEARWPVNLGIYGISLYWPHKTGYFMPSI